jgi:hypothetical protein
MLYYLAISEFFYVTTLLQPQRVRLLFTGGYGSGLQTSPGFTNTLHTSPSGLDLGRGYNNLYSHLIGGYRPNGLLHLTTPYRAYNPYSVLNYHTGPYGQSLFSTNDLSYRLRR